MAVRLIALYSQPEDPESFDAHYRDVHDPIVRRYPGILDVRLTKADGVGGRPAPFYLMAEMIFGTRTELDAALVSEPARESARDLRNFAGAGVQLFIAEDEDGDAHG